MAIGLSGMISGMDTDSIVKAMVSAQRTKATKIENKITKNKWTTDAWSALNTKIYSFYTKYASKLRLQSSYMTRTASSSNSNVATATATSSAAVGTHTLQVKQLASSQYVTGAKVSSTADTYNRNTKLTALGTGVEEGTIITFTGKLGTTSEKVVKMEVTSDTTVDNFLKSAAKAGLTATFDETQQRFFISSSQSGKDDAFSITTSALSTDAAGIMDTITDGVNTSNMTETEKATYEAAIATLRQNTDKLNTVLADDYDNTTADKTEKAVYAAIETVKTALKNTYVQETAEQKVYDDVLATIAAGESSGTFTVYEKEFNYADLKAFAEDSITTGYKFSATKDAMDILKDSGIELGEAYADPSDLTYAKVSTAQETVDALVADGKLDGIDRTNIDELNAAVEAGTLTESEVEAIKVSNTWNYSGNDSEGNLIDVQAIYSELYNERLSSATYEDAVKAVMYEEVISKNPEANAAQIKEEKDLLLADEDNAEIAELGTLLETNLTNVANAGTTSSTSSLTALGLGEITGAAVRNTDSNGDSVGMVVVEAMNSKVVLDGSTMDESSNNFTVNGLHLDLVSTTLNKETNEYDSIQITVGKDTESTYTLVKEAITEYNKLIEELNTLYNAKSARGYDPLTDEQKESMSDDDIETWESKIKNSLLRRDDTLGSLLTGMRTALNSEYTDENGEKYTLSSFGIVTGIYTESGKLHIYGDSDDSVYATYTDRLKKALEEDPEKVMETMTSIFSNLYTTMTEKCAKTEISSALTFYNDKQYADTLEDYEDELDKMEDKIADLEDRYYKQFSTMETALSKLQSQTNSLASLLGTSSGQ